MIPSPQMLRLLNRSVVILLTINLSVVFAQSQNTQKTSSSTGSLKPKKLAELEGHINSLKKEAWDELTAEFNKCLPTRLGSFQPYEDKEAYIQSGTLARDPLSGLAFFKTYKNTAGSGDTKVVISIIANSPMVSSLAAFLSNPTIAKEKGKLFTQYEGFDAIEEYDPVYHTGEINILLNASTLVSISATQLTSERILREFAKAINYQRLLAALR